MTHLEALDIIDRISYKNWCIVFREDIYYSGYILTVVAKVKDACLGYNYTQAPEINVTGKHLITYEYFDQMNKEMFTKLVKHQIVNLELHEVKEHLKQDGVCIDNPHPERKIS